MYIKTWWRSTRNKFVVVVFWLRKKMGGMEKMERKKLRLFFIMFPKTYPQLHSYNISVPNSSNIFHFCSTFCFSLFLPFAKYFCSFHRNKLTSAQGLEIVYFVWIENCITIAIVGINTQCAHADTDKCGRRGEVGREIFIRHYIYWV